MGFALAHREVAGLVNRLRQPFNVNSLAQAAAAAALDDTDFLARSVALNWQGMAQPDRAFQRLGLPYIPSWATSSPSTWPM